MFSQQRLDRLGAHAAGEVLTEPVAQLAVEQLVGDQLLAVELAEGVEHLVEAVDLALRPVADLAHLALAGLLDLAAHVALGALGLELGQVGLELGGPLLDLGVAAVLGLPLLGEISFSTVDMSRWRASASTLVITYDAK